jgi:hypothetical protein
MLGRVVPSSQFVEGQLCRVAMSVWIIVLCDLHAENTLRLARLQGGEAVLSAPFSMLDLTSRLAAFHCDLGQRFEAQSGLDRLDRSGAGSLRGERWSVQYRPEVDGKSRLALGGVKREIM